MLRCKHVAKALAEKHYSQLSALEKIALKTHVTLCFVCGKFHKDVMRMQWCVDELRRREDSEDRHCGAHLNDECKQRMQAALDAARAESKKADSVDSAE